MDMGSFMVLYFALFGLVVGSFLNVCIYRIPLKRSIVRPPSSCPHCGERIRFYDNIPLISFILLLGKCRYCRAPLSWQYPIVELLTGGISVFLFIKYGFTYQYFLYMAFMAALIIITFVDMRHQIIPDALSLPGILVGWVATWVPGAAVSWADSLIGIIAGGGALFLVAVVYERITGREGMGGGDIKLLAMIGAWMGWRQLHLIVLVASLAGTIIGITFLLLSGKGLRFRIPFGPFLSLGAVICFFFGHEIMRWYLNLLV